MPAPKTQEQKDAQKIAIMENHEASERIHALVIKIISWKAGLLDGAIINSDNKITKKEWSNYRDHILNISKIESSEKVNSSLKETQESIARNGGFE